MTARTRNRRGFSLIEVMVAMVLLALVLTTLGSLAFTVARLSLNASIQSRRMAAVSEQVGRLTVLPYDLLPAEAGCTTVTALPFPHTRCVTVTTPVNKVRSVTLIVTPAQSGVRADTVSFQRTQAITGNPFNVP